MNMKKDGVNQSNVAEYTGVSEENMYRATNTNDPKKPLADYHRGIEHPETGERLKLDHEYHEKQSGECLYAQFSDRNYESSYHYIKESDMSIDEQINEDREHSQEQDRGR